MIFDKIKKYVLTNKLVKACIFILLVGILIFYFRIFFTKGINFDDTFLKKEVVASESHYRGENAYGDIHITVKGIKEEDSKVDVIFRLPNNIIKEYTVEYKDDSNWEGDMIAIKDIDGNLIFDGMHKKNSLFLFEKSGEPFIDSDILIVAQGNEENPYNKDYNVDLQNIADIASFSNDVIRGRIYFLVFAIIVFAIAVIDIRFPLFFFTLEHCLDVRNPEPSDFYLSMQRIAWYVYPIVGLILMIVAIS